MSIAFEYEGTTYEVSDRAYDTEMIALPDGRVLHVLSWSELAPPIPREFEEIEAAAALKPAVAAQEIC